MPRSPKHQEPNAERVFLQNGTRATLSDVAALNLPHAESHTCLHAAAGTDAVPPDSVPLALGSVMLILLSIQARHARDLASSMYGYFC